MIHQGVLVVMWQGVEAHGGGRHLDHQGHHCHLGRGGVKLTVLVIIIIPWLSAGIGILLLEHLK